jgi:hypothetical protein
MSANGDRFRNTYPFIGSGYEVMYDSDEAGAITGTCIKVKGVNDEVNHYIPYLITSVFLYPTVEEQAAAEQEPVHVEAQAAAPEPVAEEQVILGKNDPLYMPHNTIYEDAARGYFKYPDGNKHPILAELVTLSDHQLRAWKLQARFTTNYKTRINKAINAFKDPEYGQQQQTRERNYNREYYQANQERLRRDARQRYVVASR